MVILNVNRVITFRWVKFLSEVGRVLHAAFLTDVGPADDNFEDKESCRRIHGNVCLILYNAARAKLLVLAFPNKDALLLHYLPLVSRALWHIPALRRRLFMLLFKIDSPQSELVDLKKIKQTVVHA